MMWTAVRTCLDIDLFNVVQGPTTVTEMAKKTGAEELLLSQRPSRFQASDHR